MKLFQIEEPDGSPTDADLPGAAIGIDASGARAAVAVAVGGNAAMLEDRDGFPLDLTVPAGFADAAAWQMLLEGARIRAERALARPVTHAVLALAATPDAGAATLLHDAAQAAGMSLLRLVAAEPRDGALAAAALAEDLAPPALPA